MKIRSVFAGILTLAGLFSTGAVFAQSLQYRATYARKSYGEPYRYEGVFYDQKSWRKKSFV